LFETIFSIASLKNTKLNLALKKMIILFTAVNFSAVNPKPTAAAPPKRT